MACNGLQEGPFHLFRHRKWSMIIFGKTHFSPIFDPFFVAKQPIFKAFGGLYPLSVSQFLDEEM